MNDFAIDDFVITYLKRAGAVVEEAGYALDDVLLPEELVPVFGQEELLLAFDYEVAQETPGSTFITHGSSWLDSIVRLAAEYGRRTALYWSGRLPVVPRSLEQKIRDQIDFQHCRPPRVATHWIEDNTLYGFYFKGVFRSFEQTEKILPVIIDGYQAIAIPGFEEKNPSLLFTGQSNYQLAAAPVSPLDKLYAVACREVNNLVREKAVPLCQQTVKLQERELTKVRGYYDGTEAEIRRKLQANSDQGRKNRLEKQLAATREDRRRRIEDTRGRYQVDVDVQLDHLVAYHLPCIFVKVNLQHKDQVLEQTLVFNPVTGEITPPPCPVCGRSTSHLTPDRHGRLTCPDCC